MKTILHFVEINAPVDKVYKAISTADGLSNWWTTNVSITDGVVDFRFMPGMTPDMKITKADPNKTVHWQCIGGHDNWQGDTFSFDLMADGDTTKMKFMQNYATEMPDEVYGTYNFNWAYYLNSLKAYAETGKGAPFQSEM